MFSSMFDGDVEMMIKTYEFAGPITVRVHCVAGENQHIERWVPHVVWSAAMELCKDLTTDNTNGLRLQDKRIIELGSGTGLCGLLCSILSQTGTCVLTDGSEDAMIELQKSIHLNPACVGRTFAAMLQWGDVKCVEDLLNQYGGPFDVVIGTDVIYEAESVEPLLKTAHACVKMDGGFIVLANHKYRFRAFEETVTMIANRLGGLQLVGKRQVADTVDVLTFQRRR